MRSRSAGRAAVVILAILVLGACSGGRRSDGETSRTIGVDQDIRASSGSGTGYMSPLVINQ